MRRGEVAIEKGGVQGVATPLTLPGLLKHGWTVVDDGNKDVRVNEEPADQDLLDSFEGDV